MHDMLDADVAEAIAIYRSCMHHELYPWQLRGFPRVLATVREGKNVCVTGDMGCGKTAIAIMTTLSYVLNTPFSLVVICSPLIVLARQLLLDIQEVFPAGSQEMFALRAGSVIDRVTKHTRILSTTYEHAQLFLATATSRLMQISLFIIDEVHEVSFGSRGLVVSEIAAVAHILQQPCLFMSATLPERMHRFLTEQLRVHLWVTGYRPVDFMRHIAIISDPELWQRVLMAAAAHCCTDEWTGPGTVVFFGRRRDAERAYLSIPVPATRVDAVSYPLPIHSPIAETITDRAERVAALTALQTATQQLTPYGIAIIFRGIGREYEEYLYCKLREGQIRMLFATSMMSVGVNLHGISHVMIHDLPDRAAAHLTIYQQMIGRAARWADGLCLVNGINPRELMDVTQEVEEEVILSSMARFVIRLASTVITANSNSAGILPLAVVDKILSHLHYFASRPLPGGAARTLLHHFGGKAGTVLWDELVVVPVPALAHTWADTLDETIHVCATILRIPTAFISPFPVPAAMLAAYVSAEKFDELMLTDGIFPCSDHLFHGAECPEGAAARFLIANGLAEQSAADYLRCMTELWHARKMSWGRAAERAHFALFRAQCMILAIAGFQTTLADHTDLTPIALLAGDFLPAANLLLDVCVSRFAAGDLAALEIQTGIATATVNLINLLDHVDLPSREGFAVTVEGNLIAGVVTPCLTAEDFACCPAHLYAINHPCTVQSLLTPPAALCSQVFTLPQMAAAVGVLVTLLPTVPPPAFPAWLAWAEMCSASTVRNSNQDDAENPIVVNLDWQDGDWGEPGWVDTI